jgi:hypothetical protein
VRARLGNLTALPALAYPTPIALTIDGVTCYRVVLPACEYEVPRLHLCLCASAPCERIAGELRQLLLGIGLQGWVSPVSLTGTGP